MTRYEIAAEKAGKRITLAFTARRTLKSLTFNTRNNGERIVQEIGADIEAVCVIANMRNGIVMSDSTRVFFTGRTERDMEQQS